jgi:two-component sensor histidine kinase
MTSRDLQTFDFAPFLEELSENLIAAGASGAIELEVHACSLAIDLDHAVPMGLIVTELVTNSLKHAFPNGAGKVRISVEHSDDATSDGEIIVTVADNGIGQIEGTTAGTGIGKRIIEGLLRQLRGRMEVDETQGTTTRLFLPQLRTA